MYVIIIDPSAVGSIKPYMVNNSSAGIFDVYLKSVEHQRAEAFAV